VSTTKTLTVAQLLVLTTAVQRPDHVILPLTIRARGGAQRNLLAALLNMELAEEVPVNDASVVWRTDEAGQHLGLRLTAAGLAASAPDGVPLAPAQVANAQPPASAISEAAGIEQTSTEPPAEGARTRLPTGKLGEVLQAISAENGATLAEITTLTGWLPHTARAAVTGLLQRGFPVQLAQQNGRKAYRLTAAG
jgi:hypothetical protein